MNQTIFTKIINGEIPCHKIYEDERTFVFLDIHPAQPGHTLVISKTPAETFLDLDEQDVAALWQTVHKVGAKLKQAFPDKKRIGVLVEGFDIPHVHISLIPADNAEESRSIADPDAEVDHPALAALAQKLAF